MLTPGLSEAVIIGAATLQKWRLKLDFEADEVDLRPDRFCKTCQV